MNINKLSIFIIGMVCGASILYIISIVRNNSDEEQLRQQMIETLSNRLTDLHKEPEVQYIEVKGKKGNVTLHTGMPKDSVKILLGKPDEVNLDEIVNTHYEKWGYKFRNRYVADLEIDFENGKLSGVRQN
nr:hypothetical protein [uncultured Flavobacterium sp.]